MKNKSIEVAIEEIKLWRPVFYGKAEPEEIEWLHKHLINLVQKAKEELRSEIEGIIEKRKNEAKNDTPLSDDAVMNTYDHGWNDCVAFFEDDILSLIKEK